jgi:menaquinone-dependent protoporphyrinogen IX oxidase
LFDLSKSSELGFWNKKIIKSAIESELGPESLMENVKNDYRDWDQIREFATKFANSIQTS